MEVVTEIEDDRYLKNRRKRGRKSDSNDNEEDIMIVTESEDVDAKKEESDTSRMKGEVKSQPSKGLDSSSNVAEEKDNKSTDTKTERKENQREESFVSKLSEVLVNSDSAASAVLVEEFVTEEDRDFNAYKEKRRNIPKPAKPIQLQAAEDSKNNKYNLFSGRWFQGRMNLSSSFGGFPSLSTSSSHSLFSLPPPAITLTLVTTLFLFGILARLFFLLPQSIFEENAASRRNKRSGQENKKSEEEEKEETKKFDRFKYPKQGKLSATLKIITRLFQVNEEDDHEEEDEIEGEGEDKGDADSEERRRRSRGFVRSFTQRESQAQIVQRVTSENDFIEQFRSILKAFLDQNPLKDLTAPAILLQAPSSSSATPHAIDPDRENSTILSPSESKKKRRWKREDYKEIEKISRSMNAIEKCFRDILDQQKQSLLSSSSSSSSSSSFSFHATNLFSCIFSIASPSSSTNSKVTLLSKAEELDNLREVFHLYYRYLVVILKQLSFYLTSHESAQIFQSIVYLETYIDAYKNQNCLFELHILQDLLYHEGLLKAYQTHHKSTNLTDKAFLLPHIIQKIDVMIQDFFEGKKAMIEQENKVYEQQLLLSSSVVAVPPSSTSPPAIRSHLSSPDSSIDFIENDYLAVNEAKSSSAMTEMIAYNELTITQQSNNHHNSHNSSQLTAIALQQQQQNHHQPTFHLIQYLHQQNFNSRLQDLKAEKEKLFSQSFTRSHSQFRAILQRQSEGERVLDQQLAANSEQYKRDLREVEDRLLDLERHLLAVQQSRNDLIFAYFGAVSFALIVIRSSDCSSCHSDGISNSWQCLQRSIGMVFDDGRRKKMMRCVFLTLESICVRINQDHLPSLMPGSVSFASSAAATSSSSSYYSVIGFLFAGSSYLVSFVSPFSEMLMSVQEYFLPYSKMFTPYFQLLFTLFTLLMRYLPIFLCSKILQLLGLSWQANHASTTTTTTHIHHHNHNHNHHNERGDQSPSHGFGLMQWTASSFFSLLSSLSLPQFCKLCIYFLCYGDIFYTLFSSFFQLLFVPCVIHFIAYQLFAAFALRLISQKRSRDYFLLYFVYFAAFLGITILTTS